MRSKFKIYSAACSSLELRKRERERWVREVRHERHFAEKLSLEVLWVRRLRATEEGAVPQGT